MGAVTPCTGSSSQAATPTSISATAPLARASSGRPAIDAIAKGARTRYRKIRIMYAASSMPSVSGTAKAIHPRKVIRASGVAAAIAIAFGPVPIGVAMPPTLAPAATARNTALAGKSSPRRALTIGRSTATITAAAATFDIHIDSNAVDSSIKATSRRDDPEEVVMTNLARRTSRWCRCAVTPKTNPPKNSTSTGSAAHVSTLANW